MSKRRVVVTGLGIISPVGNSVGDAWGNIRAGNSGIGPITNFDAADFPVRFAGEIRDFDAAHYINGKDARRMGAFIHYGIAAACQAIADSGIEITPDNAARAGVAIGSGIGGLRGIEVAYQNFLDGGPRKISPFFVPGNIINMISGNLSIMYGMKGPNIAHRDSLHHLHTQYRLWQRALIAYGDADVMVAGGAEMHHLSDRYGRFCRGAGTVDAQ